MELKVKLKDSRCLPTRATCGSAGYDLRNCGEAITINPGEYKAIDTGVSMSIEKGYEGNIRPRSGFAFNLNVIGQCGTIDSDYRGEIRALLKNDGSDTITIAPFERICQIVFTKHETPVPRIVNELTDSERGSNGFGSTGKL